MPVQRFRKRPVVIRALMYDGSNHEEVFAFTVGQSIPSKVTNDAFGQPVMIQTLEGWLKAQPGDLIIRGVKGEFYPCKPDIFVQTYEPVDQEETS